MLKSAQSHPKKSTNFPFNSISAEGFPSLLESICCGLRALERKDIVESHHGWLLQIQQVVRSFSGCLPGSFRF